MRLVNKAMAHPRTSRLRRTQRGDCGEAILRANVRVDLDRLWIGVVCKDLANQRSVCGGNNSGLS